MVPAKQQQKPGKNQISSAGLFPIGASTSSSRRESSNGKCNGCIPCIPLAKIGQVSSSFAWKPNIHSTSSETKARAHANQSGRVDQQDPHLKQNGKRQCQQHQFWVCLLGTPKMAGALRLPFNPELSDSKFCRGRSKSRRAPAPRNYSSNTTLRIKLHFSPRCSSLV